MVPGPAAAADTAGPVAAAVEPGMAKSACRLGRKAAMGRGMTVAVRPMGTAAATAASNVANIALPTRMAAIEPLEVAVRWVAVPPLGWEVVAGPRQLVVHHFLAVLRQLLGQS